MDKINEYKSFYKTVGGNEGNKCNYPTRLDTYGCGCSHDCEYCLDGNTLILMYDGTTKKLKDIEIGDEIYGVKTENKYHKYIKSIVLNKFITHKKSYKITLANGTEIIASNNHKFLTNRGWKYVTGEMTGKNRRPHLTTNNKLIGFNYSLNLPLKETDDYKKGYISGIIQGNEDFVFYDYSKKIKNKNKNLQYHVCLVLKDDIAIERTKKYLSDFGIETTTFLFKIKNKQTKEIIETKAIRTHKKDNYNKIYNFIYDTEHTKEYMRGYLAGIYDVEGTTDIYIKRFYNNDLSIIKMIETGLKLFNFKYIFDKDLQGTNKLVKTIKLTGGLSEFLRFVQIINPAIKKKFDFTNCTIKNYNKNDLKIVSIKEYKEKQELFDITTSTENFIANGIVTHNCYAKSLLNFRKLWNPQNPSIADIEKIKRKIKKLDNNKVVRLGGMTDCFQPIEQIYNVTYETIKALNEYKVPYLIVTKSSLVASDKYINILDKSLAHIQITVTTTDDKFSTTYEKAPIPSERIKAIEKLQKNGFDVQLRLSPFIPQFIDFNILNNVKCDKILIEFLRVNTWIKKWFDIDYSEYTIKQSGYQHLPLEKKIEYIKNINGFKEVTVCEDENTAYKYWKNHFNYNPNDCCNLRK